MRAYSAASWVWVAMYVLRVAILTPFWNSDEERLAVVAGGIAQVVLSWPLLVLCLIVSGWVIRAILPKDHPGIRHPLTRRQPRNPKRPRHNPISANRSAAGSACRQTVSRLHSWSPADRSRVRR